MAKTLLLADDSVTIQKVVNISFASENVTLVTVDNGDDAVERAKETRPDLILADVVMPGKNGYEVCEAIKADPDLCHIPVLLLSGTFEAFDEEHAKRIGAAGHVAKPFEAQTLVDQVNRLLAEAPPAAPAPAATPAPAPAGPPETATADAQNENSFDFFDDDLDDFQTPEPVAASDAVSFRDSDSAFAFGDEEFTPVAPESRRAEATPPPAPAPDIAAPFEDESFPDRTVAILPDDSEPAAVLPADPAPLPSSGTPTTALSTEIDDDGFADSGEELLAVAESDLEDSFTTVDPSAASDEGFDFAFESESTAPEAIAVEPDLDDGLMSVEEEDLAQATVLDPNGASGYDVSSSDLGAPFAVEPVLEDGERAEATRMMDAPPMLREPVAAAEIVDATGAGEDLEAAVFAPEEEPAAPAAVFEPLEVPVARPDVPRSLPEDSAARAESILAEITPDLRESIHDTLEKITWESFGDVTEKIVAEVVDRVEKIAWEVIPQLTEALIKAEIRRMKGEIDV